MKKIILVALLILVNFQVFSQSEIKSSTSEGYTGVGLSFVFFTNKDVWNIYPFLDISNTSFVTEVTPYIGYKFSKTVSLEFAPGFLMNRSYSKNGFFFTNELGIRQYYVPQNVTLVAIPVNARAKIFPFAKNAMISDFVYGLYCGSGLGIMFIGESYDNYIYVDDISLTPIGTKISKKNSWVFNSQVFIGFEFQSRLGLGVEIGYRIVPTNNERKVAVVSDIAPNMSYFYLNFKGRLGF